jgi:predicted CoA-binding protein
MSIEEEILKNSHTIAIVGLSANTQKPSNFVAAYLKSKGYKIIPVNPGEKTILGETSYPDLTSVPVKVDVVDIFRKAEDVPPVAKQAIKIGAKTVWMQEGIKNEAAAAEATQAGLTVVMDKCMRKEHMKLSGGD